MCVLCPPVLEREKESWEVQHDLRKKDQDESEEVKERQTGKIVEPHLYLVVRQCHTPEITGL